jgi:hypothetical protein
LESVLKVTKMTPSQDLNCLTTVVLQKWPPHKTSIVLLLLYYRNDLLTRPQLSYYCCITEMTSSQDLNCLTTVVLQKWPPHKTSFVLLLLYYRNDLLTRPQLSYYCCTTEMVEFSLYFVCFETIWYILVL